MRCLVTGATGHVGAFLTRALLARGCDIAVLVRPESDLGRIADISERVTLIHGSLGDLSRAEAPLKQWHAETVFHLAWQGVTGGFRNDPSQITRNVSGSLKLFEIVQKAGCHTWVGIGSQAEYGHHSGTLREDLCPQPITAYGVAKLCTGLLTENLCAMAGMRFVWLRLLATYGPMDDPRHLIPSVINQLLDRQKPALTLGEQRWDYLYIDDAVDAICRLALETDALGIFNLGSGDAPTVRELVETVRDLIDPSLPLGFGEVSYRPDQIMHLQARITKLQSVTHWHPQVSLREGLVRTVAWHRAQKQAQ